MREGEREGGREAGKEGGREKERGGGGERVRALFGAFHDGGLVLALSRCVECIVVCYHSLNMYTANTGRGASAS